ncbi:MAG: RNA methyltransferase [Bacteroidota bacterium]
MIDHDLLTYLEGFLTDQRKQRFVEILSQCTTYLTVAVEDVYHLHNTSAIIRSCDSFGIQEVHAIEDRFGDRLDKKIALGAEKWVDVHRHATTVSCIQHLKAQGYQIVATVPQEGGQLLSNFEVTTKTAVFFGTEREGLSEAMQQHADAFLQIPMVGFSESLNVSVSAAIIIQKLADELRKSRLPWHLSDLQQQEKRFDWIKKSIKIVEQIIGHYQNPS